MGRQANLFCVVINFDPAVGRTLSQVVERVGVGRICSVGHSVRASSSSHRCRWWCRVQYHLGPDMILNLQLHGREGNDSGHHRSQQAPSNLHMTTGLAATTAVRGRPPEEEALLAHAHTRSLLVLASAPTARFPRLGRVLRLMARCVRTPSSPAGRPPVPAPRPPHAHAHDRLSNGRRGRDAHGRGRQARRAARRGVALVRGQGAAVRPEPPQLRRGGGCHGAPGRARAGWGRHVPNARHRCPLVGATGLGEGGIFPPGCHPFTTSTTDIATPRRSGGETTTSHRCAASPHEPGRSARGGP